MTQPTNHFDFVEEFKRAVRENQRVFSHDRTQSLGASETFGCILRAWFSKFRPETADPALMSLGAAERGNVVENLYVVPRMRQIFKGKRVEYMGDEQHTLKNGRNSATPDGLIFPDRADILTKYGVPDIESDNFAIEVKSFDPRMNLEAEKFVHRGQGIMQLGLFRETTEFKPVYVLILYVNASDFFDVRPFVVKFDATVYDVGKQRAELVFKTTDPYTLRTEGIHTDSCGYCPYIDACRKIHLDKFPDRLKGDIPKEKQERLSELAKEHTKALRAEQAAAREKSERAEDIRRLLQDVNVRKIAVSSANVSFAKMDGKEALDREAMERDGIDLSKYMKEGRSFTRLLVTPKSEV